MDFSSLTDNPELAALVLYVLIQAVLAFVPQGKPGSFWDQLRTGLNVVALNVKNSKNERKVPGGGK